MKLSFNKQPVKTDNQLSLFGDFDKNDLVWWDGSWVADDGKIVKGSDGGTFGIVVSSKYFIRNGLPCVTINAYYNAYSFIIPVVTPVSSLHGVRLVPIDSLDAVKDLAYGDIIYIKAGYLTSALINAQLVRYKAYYEDSNYKDCLFVYDSFTNSKVFINKSAIDLGVIHLVSDVI